MVQFKQQQRRRKQKTIGPTVAQDFKTVHAASFEGGRRKGTLAKSGNVVVHGFLRHAAGPVQKDVDARHVHVAKEHGECPYCFSSTQSFCPMYRTYRIHGMFSTDSVFFFKNVVGTRPKERGAVQIVQHCDAIEKSVQPPLPVRRGGGSRAGPDGGTFDRQLREIAIVGQIVGEIEDGWPPGVDL